MKERTLRLPKGLFMSYTNAYTVPSDLPSELKNLHSWVMCTTLGRPMIMIIASTGIIYTATAVGGNEQWVFSDFIKS